VNVLVGYFSESGNTKRIAEAIATEATSGGHTVDVKTIGELTPSALTTFDVAFLGTTCHSSDLAAPLRNLLDGLPTGVTCRIAGFVTHAVPMPEDGTWRAEMYEKWAGRCPQTFEALCAAKNVCYLGYFHCQGAPNPPIEAFIRTSIITDDALWAEYSADMHDHPNEADLAAARAFAKDALTED